MDAGNQYDVGEISTFFTAWERLPKQDVVAKPVEALDCKNFQIFANAFPSAYAQYRRSGHTVNLWTIAGLSSDELRNSAVLAWLLDSFGNHGQGSKILEQVLQLNVQPRASGITPENLQKPYWTRVETLPLGEMESRIDIEIESAAFLIFLEIKINAPETNNQLQRYVDLAKEKAAGRPYEVIYITKNGRLPTDKKLHGEITAISWSQVSRSIRDYAKNELPNTTIGHAIQQFSEHLITFSRHKASIY